MRILKSVALSAAVLASLGLLATGIWRAAQSPVVIEAPVPAHATVQGAVAGPLVSPQSLPSAAVVIKPPVVQQTGGPGVAVPVTIDQSRPAEESMADARVNGDRRAPPINRVPETNDPPTPAELADPKLYAKYEKRQSSRAYASYVQAVDAAVPEQQALLARAKAQGMPPEQQAVVEEKIRRMQQMRDQLVSEHPEIAK